VAICRLPAGIDQLERFSWTGTSYIARDGHSTERGFSSSISISLSQVDSNKQCFHNIIAYLSAARNIFGGGGGNIAVSAVLKGRDMITESLKFNRGGNDAA
jgi:hypothetical protein